MTTLNIFRTYDFHIKHLEDIKFSFYEDNFKLVASPESLLGVAGEVAEVDPLAGTVTGVVAHLVRTRRPVKTRGTRALVYVCVAKGTSITCTEHEAYSLD